MRPTASKSQSQVQVRGAALQSLSPSVTMLSLSGRTPTSPGTSSPRARPEAASLPCPSLSLLPPSVPPFGSHSLSLLFYAPLRGQRTGAFGHLTSEVEGSTVNAQVGSIFSAKKHPTFGVKFSLDFFNQPGEQETKRTNLLSKTESKSFFELLNNLQKKTGSSRLILKA